ncbi:MAG: multiprotein-bridging factor 1 family protein [Thermoplasmata archaeon]|nr:multiprotein-bridging factor 1 family protein [Thermoplasmata archaeon]
MCGNDVETTSRVKVEGSVLRLCPDCARFGEAVEAPPAPARASSTGAPAPIGAASRPLGRSRSFEERDLFKELPEMELAEDWGKRIRQAREKLLWSPEEFGKRLNEKKSIILKLESGSFRPPDATIRKIEQLLKVRLRAEPAGPAT